MQRVLIVDDSAVARRALATRLGASGWETVAEATTARALALSLDDVACAVLDLDLGDGDGVTLAKALRAKHPALRIAFFSGTVETELVERAHALGPVFSKPDDVEGLVAWVTEAANGS